MWVTIEDVINAAEKNGLTWIKGNYLWYNNDGVPEAGCAIGQMAYNLECTPEQLHNVLNDIDPDIYKDLGSQIVRENDSRQTESYYEVVEAIHGMLDGYKDKKISLRKVKYHK